MTINGISISGKGSPTIDDIEQLERRSMEFHWSTVVWEERCGQGCPGIWRLTYGLEGVGTYEWSRGAHLSNDVFAETHMRWSLGDECYNAYCPYRAE